MQNVCFGSLKETFTLFVLRTGQKITSIDSSPPSHEDMRAIGQDDSGSVEKSSVTLDEASLEYELGELRNELEVERTQRLQNASEVDSLQAKLKVAEAEIEEMRRHMETMRTELDGQRKPSEPSEGEPDKVKERRSHRTYCLRKQDLRVGDG
mmetsp:Transcript_38236/g.151360  ORF Transcript_38236/g.151360 Transcript_38236/m.151360 type:complete len:152 (-) Transcript_38236:4573-5028(-)